MLYCTVSRTTLRISFSLIHSLMHPSIFFFYPGLGHMCSSFSRKARTFLSPATSSSSPIRVCGGGGGPGENDSHPVLLVFSMTPTPVPLPFSRSATFQNKTMTNGSFYSFLEQSVALFVAPFPLKDSHYFVRHFFSRRYHLVPVCSRIVQTTQLKVKMTPEKSSPSNSLSSVSWVIPRSSS